MAEPQIFDNAICYINGRIFVNATSIEVTYEDADKPVFLMDGGFAIAPGERLMRITLVNAISKDSEAFDMVKRYLEVESLNFAVQLISSGARLTSKGHIIAPGFSFGVGQNASYRVGFVGKAAEFA